LAARADAIEPERLRDFERLFAEHEAKEFQRELQQGRGRPIISETFQGYRFVAVGGRLCYSKNWKTFHDFLFWYLPHVIGREWGKQELAKPDPHPLLKLFRLVADFMSSNNVPEREIQNAPASGAAMAYLGLAYNLYLLAHNAEVQERLLKRLRDRDNFWPAVHETFVAGVLIRAGFDIAIENEGDVTTTHCEFTARHRVTGRSYSVEAKRRQAGKPHAAVSNQLYAALRKSALHERVVFIEMSVGAELSASPDPLLGVPWLRSALDSLRSREETLQIDGIPAPPAYVVLTNQPFEACLEAPYAGLTWALEGFKIPEVRIDSTFGSVRELRLARERHRPIYELAQSLRNHSAIPITFDGEIPEFAFGEPDRRLIIGRRYQVPRPDGTAVEGRLETATVDVLRAQAFGALRLDDGQNIIATFDLSAEEVAAYRQHPDTFFGIFHRQGQQIQTALEMYDFMFRSYGQNSKENLLRLMSEHPDIATLAGQSRDELAVLYCERMSEAAIRSAATASLATKSPAK
jgi:hypothetical protein